MQRHPEKRRDILKHLASNVSPLITKGCYNHSLVHTVLYNYMIGLNHQMEAMPSENERRGKERSEFIASLRYWEHPLLLNHKSKFLKSTFNF